MKTQKKILHDENKQDAGAGNMILSNSEGLKYVRQGFEGREAVAVDRLESMLVLD